MIQSKSSKIILRSLAWFVILTQVTSSASFADIKVPSKDTLAPKIISDATPPTKSDNSEPRQDMVCEAVFRSMGQLFFNEHRSIAEVQKLLRDTYSGYSTRPGGVLLDTIKPVGKSISVEYRDSDVPEVCIALLYPKDHGSSNSFGIDKRVKGRFSDEAGSISVEPLIGHKFTETELANVSITPWNKSEAFSKTLDELGERIKARALNSVTDRILKAITDFRNSLDGRKLGTVKSVYESSARYYLGFGVKNTIGLAAEFFDPRNPLYEHRFEALFHEIFHAEFGRDDEYSGMHDTSTHLLAMQLAATIFWKDMTDDKVRGLTLEALEGHARNKFGDQIRSWKEYQQLKLERVDVPKAMAQKDWKYLLNELRASLKVGWESNRSVPEFLIACDEAAALNKRHPVEARYPIIKAVTYLSKKEKEALITVLMGTECAAIRSLPVVDSILLMLKKEVPADWLSRQAPKLKERSTWIVSSEVWNAGGGLGRVEQSHSIGDALLLKQEGPNLKTCEPYYTKTIDKKTGSVIDTNYPVLLGINFKEIKEVDRFEVPVGDSIAVAVCYMAINKFGIESYLIKGFKKGQAETEAPYYTERLYHYRNEKEPNLVSLAEFAAFLSKASLELTRRVEMKKRVLSEGAYYPPVMHFNDGQLGLAPLFRRIYYKNDPILGSGKAMVGYSTHTYPNRCWVDRKSGEDMLRYLDIPQDAWKYFYRHYETIIDLTSAGARTADWYAGVSAKHVDDILSYKYDNWGEWEYLNDTMVSVTNGDIRSATAHVFREIMLELFPDADVEEPTPEQVLATKREAKKRLGLREDQPVVSYSGRVVREKASRGRAFCDENIRKMVIAGIQVVIGANVAANPDMVEHINSFAALEVEIARDKLANPKLYKGSFTLMRNIDIEVQRAILAATDIQIQDSDPNTEAAGYSEADVAVCGGLELAPSWTEGILQSQGIPINLNIPGEGNTIIPKDGNPESYFEAVMSVLEKFPEELAKYQANAVRLSSILEALLTSAEYLRQWNRTVEKMEAAAKADAEVIVKDLKGPKAPDSNTVISDLIANGRMLEVTVEDGALRACHIRYVDGYRPGVKDPNRYRGPPVDINMLFTKEEQSRLASWIDKNPVKDRPIRFRIAMNQSSLGWKDDIEHSNISHAGFSDTAIYIGEKFLKYLLKPENSELFTEILDRDELEHLKENFRDDRGVHRYRLDLVNEVMEKLEASDRIQPGSLDGSAMIFKNSESPFKRSLENAGTREVHIITAGGGGDVLGGAFMALQMRRIMGGGVKIKVFTSNLKRGEENPEGGPLRMENIKDSFGNNVSPVSGAIHFYRISEGLYADTAIKDANLNEIRGYRAKVPLSEGRINDFLRKEGIELIMADVSQSGGDLAKDYLSWQRASGNIDHVFVVGLDMGGDILARFPGEGRITKDHPEAGVRSPNTDAVFLDMFAEVEKDEALSERILLGISALGGDGELGQVLKEYVRDSFSAGEVEAVLDNVKFVAENDPQGDRYRGIVTEGLRAINSEVSGNFLMRLLAIARITPLLDKSFGKTFERTSHWGDIFSQNRRMRGFSQKEIFDPAKLSEELPKGLSRGYIRNLTRQEILPLAYPLTVFMRPSAVHNKIIDPAMKDPNLTWMQKDGYLRAERGYETEMSDKNNVSTREFVNGYLLKTSVLDRAWQIKERSERSNFIANELVLLKSKYRLQPGIENDLESIRSMLSENIDDITAGISYSLGLSEDDSEKLSGRLAKWLNNTEDRLRSSKNVSAYVYSYFTAHILGDIAEFFGRLPSAASIDEYMGMVEQLMGSIEEIGKTQEGHILSSIMAESLLPKLLGSSPDRETLRFKEKALLEFVKERFGGGLRTWESFHFIKFVLPEAIAQKFSGEKHLKESLVEIYDFAAEVVRAFPKEGPDDLDPQRKDVSVLMHYYIFGKIFPEALKMCPDIAALKRFNGVIRDVMAKTRAGELRYSYLFPVLDFIADTVASGKAGSAGDIERLKNSLLAISEGQSEKSVNLSPVIRFMIKASQNIGTFEETIFFVEALGKGVLRADRYVQSFTYHGVVYDISSATKTRVLEIVKTHKAQALRSALEALDYNAPEEKEERIGMEEEFKDAEESAFLMMGEKLRSGKTAEALLVIPDIKSVRAIDDFDRETDVERDRKNYERGLELLRAGRCAAGCTAGFVSGIPLDYLSADFSMKIMGTDGTARRFIEWKLYMLERMNRLYGLENNPIPAVVMTAFAHNDLEDLLKETGNFNYNGDVIPYHQGPTKAMDENGAAIKVDGQDYYATPGAWGFIKWLVISGKIKELRGRGIKYLTDSNINNPIEPVSASIIGYFDRKIEETRIHSGEVPLVLAELGDYAQERGGFAREITYMDGRKERRIVHELRLPEGTPPGDSYNLANWVLNLDGIWERFRLGEIDFGNTDERALRKALAGRVAEVEKESRIEPVLRERVINGKKCYINEYILDDVTALGHWVGVKVNRDRHFVSLKSPDDIYDYHRTQVMSDAMRSIDIEIFRQENPIVDYLMAKNVIGPLQDETSESLRARVVRLFLPSRVFKEDRSLLASDKRYVPGVYVQGEITDKAELVNNGNYRKGIIRTEIGLLCRAYPDREGKKDELINEANEVMEKVLDLSYDGKHRLLDVITNPESNLLVRRCVRLVFFGGLDISGFDGADYNPYAVVNAVSNDLVVRRLTEKGPEMKAEDILLESVAAIKLKKYFQEHDNYVDGFDASYKEVFDTIETEKAGNNFESKSPGNMKRFMEEIGKGRKEVAYITDDNGEVVYHLYLMQRYLENNPDLSITLIPRSRQNGIDASFDDILQVLSYPLFDKLRKFYGTKRFAIVKDSTRMGGVDLLRASPETRDALDRCDFVFSSGLVNHETIYNFSKPAYHILIVNGMTSSRVTGHPEGTYLFLRDEAGDMRNNPFDKGEDKSGAVNYTVVRPENFARTAADKVAGEIKRLQARRPGRDVVMVFATGNTMVGFLDGLSKAEGIDWNRLQAYHLDEYRGLTIDHPSSFAYFLNKNLFSKVPIPRGNIHYIYEYVARYGGKAEKAFEAYLNDMGEPDITMLGVGLNGHLAFNEPPKYAYFDSHMQVVFLGDSTVAANRADYPALEEDVSTRFAYTMGIADILASRKIFFLANKPGKAEIVAKVLSGPVSENVPASILQQHPDTAFILDTGAASMLDKGPAPEVRVDKDLKGPKAPDSNTVIGGLIAGGRMCEVTIEDGTLKAYQVSYIDGYEPGISDPNRYRGPPVGIDTIFNPEEAGKFTVYLNENVINGKPARFRVVMDSAALGWGSDPEHVLVAHAGRRDGVVYIGRDLLKRMFQNGNETLRDEVLIKDEFRHLAGKDHGTAEEYNERLALVWSALESIASRNSTIRINMPDLASVSFKASIGSAPSADEYYANNKNECSKVLGEFGSSAGKTYYYFSGRGEIESKEGDIFKILLSKDVLAPDGSDEGSILVYYHIRPSAPDLVSRDNSITIVMRSALRKNSIVPGGDRLRGEEGWDESTIKIYLDGNSDRVSMVDYKIKHRGMHLSRTMMGMLLKDAKLTGGIEGIYDLLKQYLIFPEITPEIRIREMKDNIPVPLRLISDVKLNPSEVSEENIKKLEDFSNYKSWSIRELALGALLVLRNAGRISPARYAASEAIFESLSIEEDRKYVERFLIEKPGLIEKILSKLQPGRSYGRQDISSIEFKWLGRGKNKSVYRIWFKTKDGASLSAAVSTIRHNPWNFNFDRKSLERSIMLWDRLSVKGNSSVPQLLAYEWAEDFRPRMTDINFDEVAPENISDKGWAINDIAMVFRTYAEGDDLSWVLANPKIAAAAKEEMIRAALQQALDIWNSTKDSTGKGLFIGDPKPANIAVRKDGNGFSAESFDLDVLGEFAGFDAVRERILQYREYDGFEIIYESGRAKAVKKETRLPGQVNIATTIEGSSSVENNMTAIHEINLELLPPVENGKVLYHVITEEIIPVTMRNDMANLARYTENLKLRERVRIVKRNDLQSQTSLLKASSNNIVLAAVQSKEDLALLPKDVKALVFAGADGGAFGFKQLEGIMAALRALERSDAGALARLYRMLTGMAFTGKENDILKCIKDPQALANIIVFTLEPSVAKDTEELKRLNRALLEFLYKA